MDSNDGVLSAAAAAAKDASTAFHWEKFSECMHVLNQLLQNNGDDPKVLPVNFTEYYYQIDNVCGW